MLRAEDEPPPPGGSVGLKNCHGTPMTRRSKQISEHLKRAICLVPPPPSSPPPIRRSEVATTPFPPSASAWELPPAVRIEKCGPPSWNLSPFQTPLGPDPLRNVDVRTFDMQLMNLHSFEVQRIRNHRLISLLSTFFCALAYPPLGCSLNDICDFSDGMARGTLTQEPREKRKKIAIQQPYVHTRKSGGGGIIDSSGTTAKWAWGY